MGTSVETFFESVIRGDAAAVRAALAADPSLAAARDRQMGTTPLHVAVHRGRLEIARALLDHEADPNALERASGTTPLHWAAEAGEPELVRLLLERGAGLEIRDAWFGLTPLGWSTVVVRVRRAGQDRPGATRALREAGARPDAFVELACHDLEAVRRVVAADPAEVSRRLGFGEEERQPLHWAAANGKEEVIEALAGMGADLHARTALGLTPMGAALQRAQSGCAAALVRCGAAGDETTAVVGGFVAALEGVPADVLTPELASRLLFVAAGEGHAEMVKALVARGADPKHRIRRLVGEVGMMATALHAAAVEGHVLAIRALIEAGAPVNAGQEEGAPTPLHLAASEGQELAARMLLEYGADRTVRDGGFEGTPADWASAFGHKAIAALLRKA